MFEAGRSRNRLVFIAIVVGVGLILGALLRVALERWWVSVLLVPIILLGVDRRPKLPAVWQAALFGLLLAVIGAAGLQSVRIIGASMASPPEWDYTAFWLDGRVADQDQNFYQAPAYQQAAQGLTPSADFTQEILNVGFRYPPPTIWLFVPLGWFSLNTAAQFWYLFLTLLLILNSLLLWIVFLRDAGGVGLLLAAALLLLLRPTLSTLQLGQTNFLVLMMLVLFWGLRNHWSEGIWAALSIIVKPYMVVLVAFQALRKRWKGLAWALGTLIGLGLVTLVFFGPTTFFGYITENPTAKQPGYVYMEAVNQSMFATLLRVTHSEPSQLSMGVRLAFLALAALLIVVTAWLTYRVDEDHADLGLALCLTAGLLIYPGTSEHYGVLLIVPLLFLWARRLQIPGGLGVPIGLITLVYLFTNISNGTLTFVAFALSWAIFAALSVWRTRQSVTSASRQPAATA